MEKLYKLYKNKVQFFLVYTREIHPAHEENQRAGGRRRFNFGGPKIKQHEKMQDRVIAAAKCSTGLKLSLPFLLDTMDNKYHRTYSAIPAGTAVIDINGKIAYWNRGSPMGCRPQNAEKAIKALLAKDGGAKEKKWAPIKMPTTKKPGKDSNKNAKKESPRVTPPKKQKRII